MVNNEARESGKFYSFMMFFFIMTDARALKRKIFPFVVLMEDQ